MFCGRRLKTVRIATYRWGIAQPTVRINVRFSRRAEIRRSILHNHAGIGLREA